VARSSRRSRSARPRADWVYRGNHVDAEGSQDNGLSTYSPYIKSVTQGESAGHILYDSKNFLRDIGGNSYIMNQTGRAAGKRPKMVRVMGQMTWVAGSWSPGDEIQFGLRIGVFQQDSSDGFIQVDASYTMMGGGGGIVNDPDIWANQPRANRWEWRNYQYFATGNESSRKSVFINANMRGVTLSDDECLALYVENGVAASVTSLRYITWLRTLVIDEGSG